MWSCGVIITIHSSDPPLRVGGVDDFGFERLRGGVAGFSGFRGDLSVCGGLNFPGGFGLRRRKSPPVAYESTNFQIN